METGRNRIILSIGAADRQPEFALRWSGVGRLSKSNAERVPRGPDTVKGQIRWEVTRKADLMWLLPQLIPFLEVKKWEAIVLLRAAGDWGRRGKPCSVRLRRKRNRWTTLLKRLKRRAPYGWVNKNGEAL